MKPKDDEKQRAIAQATFELVAQTGLSGLTMAEWGNLNAMWYADMALAGFAALVNLPIRESAPEHTTRS